jgi:DNA (cytosine-5)-methyltransferase 1
MGLDLGLESAGLAATLAVELDPWCCKTIRDNRPYLKLMERDLNELSAADLRSARGFDGEVYLMAGGPPCQSFCPGGNRSALSDPRGNLIYVYLKLIQQVKPRYFLLENVANLTTAALRHRSIKDRPGQNWNLSAYNGKADGGCDDGVAPMEPDEMSGSAIRQILSDVTKLDYSVNFGILDAADYGAPQHRLRFVMIGSRQNAIPELPKPSHGASKPGNPEHRVVREAIYDLRENPGPHSSYTEEMARFFRMIPPGGSWRDLPKELQREALGPSFEAGGGKTGFFRRLDYERPAPTVTTKPNRKGSAMCHPEFVRPLSVRECARIQGFPDDWHFSGAMNQQYQQIGNAVPVHLGAAVAGAIVAGAGNGPDGAGGRGTIHFERLLDNASRRLRLSARNKRSRDTTLELFAQR